MSYHQSLLDSLPPEVAERAESIKEDNPDMEAGEAIAIAYDQLDLANDCPEGQVEINGQCLDVETVEDVPPTLLEEDPCEPGWVMVGTKQQDGQTVPNCVPEEDADPADFDMSLSQPKFLADNDPLESSPIEREQLSDGEVAYRNIKLLDTGVWTDEASKTPTLYDGETFENLDLEYDGDGPPINVSHDLDNDGNVNEASVGGYIEPDSVRTNGDALFADVVLQTDTGAGQFLDDNIRSALESGGAVGFSPSVELTPLRMQETPNHPQADEHVTAARLSGTAFVRDPASRTVDFAYETANRAVAMSAVGQSTKRLDKVDTAMSDMDIAGLAGELNLSESETSALLEKYKEDGEEEDQEEEEEEGEMGQYEDYYEEDEEDEQEMEDGHDEEDLMATISELKSRMEELEQEHAQMRDQMMSEDDAENLADADTVEDVEQRLSEVESTTKKLADEPADRKTLADTESGESVFDTGRRMTSTDASGTTTR